MPTFLFDDFYYTDFVMIRINSMSSWWTPWSCWTGWRTTSPPPPGLRPGIPSHMCVTDSNLFDWIWIRTLYGQIQILTSLTGSEFFKRHGSGSNNIYFGSSSKFFFLNFSGFKKKTRSVLLVYRFRGRARAAHCYQEFYSPAEDSPQKRTAIHWW